MSFVSLKYLIFLIVCVFLYYVIPQKTRWIVLLTASVTFYCIFSKWLIVFLLLTTLIIYLCGLKVQALNDLFQQEKTSLERAERKVLKETYRKKKMRFVALAVVLNLGILVALKYVNFLGDTVDGIFALFGSKDLIPTVPLLLPLGISYYTLMAISYSVDVYRGQNMADRNFFRLFLFLIFFPQIVEGPFGRYNKLADNLYNGNQLNFNNLKSAAMLILWGFIKKMVMADRCAIIVNEIFDNYTSYGGITVIMGVVLYVFQIYMDFSGCIDIVRGSAGMFGVTLEENFKRPFFSKNIDEFWRRWHITLGAFFRDYIFYPVSMSKGFERISSFSKKHFGKNLARVLPLAFALFFVWLSNGLWHGASIKYVIYGLYYYVIMIVAQLFKPASVKTLSILHIKEDSKWYSCFQILRTDLLVCIGMLIFRADSLRIAASMFQSIFTSFAISGAAITTPIYAAGAVGKDLLVILASIVFMFFVGVYQERHSATTIRAVLDTKPFVWRWIAIYIGVMIVLIFGVYGPGYNSIESVYAQF